MNRCVIIPFFASTLIPLGAAAQTIEGPYVNLGAGVDLLQNEIVKPFELYGPTKRSYRFHPGPAVSLGAGYGFGNGFRLEISGDYANNHVRSVKYPIALAAGGYQQQYGGFLNGFYDLDLKGFSLDTPVVPFVGVGAGYQEIELDGVSSSTPGRPRGSRGEREGNFAYEAAAGLSYPLEAAPGLSITVEYRFIGVLTPPAFPRSRGTNTVSSNGVLNPYRATFGNTFNHNILIGVRYEFGHPAPYIHPEIFPPDAPVAETRSYLIFFDWDRSDLTNRARQIVAEAARASTGVQTTRVEVNGYTDRSGTVTYNEALSMRRARVVQAALVADGVNINSIFIQGYGETKPLVPTADGIREPQNRRVEIILR